MVVAVVREVVVMSGDDEYSVDVSARLKKDREEGREGFYVELDKGIDSDIEELSATAGPSRGAEPEPGRTQTPSVLSGSGDTVSSDGTEATVRQVEDVVPLPPPPPPPPLPVAQTTSPAAPPLPLTEQSTSTPAGAASRSPDQPPPIPAHGLPLQSPAPAPADPSSLPGPSSEPQAPQPSSSSPPSPAPELAPSAGRWRQGGKRGHQRAGSDAAEVTGLLSSRRHRIQEPGRSRDSRGTEADIYAESDFEAASVEVQCVDVDPAMQNHSQKMRSCDALILVVSALYCKLLVVIGLAFPLSEVISSDIPPFYYKVFYIYLYSISILFLLYVYVFLLKDRSDLSEGSSSSKLSKLSSASASRLGRLLRLESATGGAAGAQDGEGTSQASRASRRPYLLLVANYGSFYLRMGAVLFGIGSMIYSGLVMGQYFELPDEGECTNILIVITPGLRLAFTFVQMYFIFLNASMCVNEHKLVARFGLMHMVGTNLCVWLNVVIEETKHELVHLLRQTEHLDDHRRRRDLALSLESVSVEEDSDASFLREDLEQFRLSVDGTALTKCARADIMGRLVDSASPFLFPCTIEYSLICAATLYVMWKNLNKLNTVCVVPDGGISAISEKHKKHQYSVDCARASKGLFLGILVFVASVISLILFFVLINKPSTRAVAILSGSITELVLYGVTVLATVVGMVQIHRLRYDSERNIELDNILLVVAQTGVYLYASFNIIGSHFSEDVYSLVTGVMSILQVTVQTMFILDASCRQAYKTRQVRHKPGREIVTFLLICNLAMWCINTFETSRSDAHPKQLHFFGFWAWTIISHVSMPLAIFYRFHSTVCLCEIWKRAYKYKPDAV